MRPTPKMANTGMRACGALTVLQAPAPERLVVDLVIDGRKASLDKRRLAQNVMPKIEFR
jgi:hypothetical protein